MDDEYNTLDDIISESINSMNNVNIGLDEDFEKRMISLQEDIDNQFNKILNSLYAKKDKSNT